MHLVIFSVLTALWIFSSSFSPLKVSLKEAVEIHLRNLEVARTCSVDPCVWPGSHSQWPVLVYPRHVSASCCHHPPAPAIAVSVDAAGGVAMKANIAVCCSCHAHPFSVPAASSRVATLQCPFRLHWCMCWSNRHAPLQPNDLLVLCYCSICVFMKIGNSLSENLVRPQVHVQVWQVWLQTHDATFERHLVPTAATYHRSQ